MILNFGYGLIRDDSFTSINIFLKGLQNIFFILRLLFLDFLICDIIYCLTFRGFRLSMRYLIILKLLSLSRFFTLSLVNKSQILSRFYRVVLMWLPQFKRIRSGFLRNDRYMSLSFVFCNLRLNPINRSKGVIFIVFLYSWR